MKKRMLSVLSLIMAIVMLAGCGAKTETPDAPAKEETKVEEPSTPSTPETPAPSKVVNLAISENAITLDPHMANNQGSNIVVAAVYENLILGDSAGHYWPWLATEYSFNEDGTVWNFKLREGVTFSDGTVFNADDVVCTYQRAIDNYESLNNIVGLWPNYALKSVEKVNDYEVNITLNETLATCMNGFANTPIISAEAWEEYGDSMFAEQNLIATGPWVLDEWVDGQYAHYYKNENYWNKANYDSYYEEMYIRHVLENSTGVAGQLAGDLDAYVVIGGINPDMLALYEGSEDKVEIFSQKSTAYYYLGFQCGEGSVFADVKARQAFEMAIDRQSILDAIMGGGAVSSSLIHEGVLGFDPALPQYEYNPEKAKALLEESSYDGRLITLSSNTSTTKGEEQLLAISDNVNAIGFNSTVQIVENATLLEMRQGGNYDVFLVITMMTGGDPGGILSQRIMQDCHTSRFVDEKMNDLIATALKTVDSEARGELYRQAMARMREVSAPHTSLYAPAANFPVNYGIVGMELYGDGTVRLAFVDYDETMSGFRGPDYDALTAGL